MAGRETLDGRLADLALNGFDLLIAHVLESGVRARDWPFLRSRYAEHLATCIGIEPLAWRYHVAHLGPRRRGTYAPVPFARLSQETGPNAPGIARGREYRVVG